MYTNILIPTDGSELAQRAVTHGLALAKAVDAPVTIVAATEMWAAMDMAAGLKGWPGGQEVVVQIDVGGGVARSTTLARADKLDPLSEQAAKVSTGPDTHEKLHSQRGDPVATRTAIEPKPDRVSH